jgi:hypothetical protein
LYQWKKPFYLYRTYLTATSATTSLASLARSLALSTSQSQIATVQLHCVLTSLLVNTRSLSSGNVARHSVTGEPSLAGGIALLQVGILTLCVTVGLLGRIFTDERSLLKGLKTSISIAAIASSC